jgi:hypothetical protein
LTEQEAPSERLAVALSVFNALVIGVGSLYQASRSLTVTITAASVAAILAGWAILIHDRTHRHVKRVPPELAARAPMTRSHRRWWQRRVGTPTHLSCAVSPSMAVGDGEDQAAQLRADHLFRCLIGTA